jgi:hypothetical protein
LSLAAVSAEAVNRLASARAFLRVIEAHEKTGGSGTGDVASRSGKGMLFVSNYAAYEYVVVEIVKSMIGDINQRGLTYASVRTDLMALALDSDFSSVIDGALKKTWAARSLLLKKTRSTTAVVIKDNLFPKDGSQFRAAQLETIWNIFGVPLPIVPEPRLLDHIREMVDTRNDIAHGSQAPEHVGGRFSIVDIERRINDTEKICTHLIASVGSYLTDELAYI